MRSSNVETDLFGTSIILPSSHGCQPLSPRFFSGVNDVPQDNHFKTPIPLSNSQSHDPAPNCLRDTLTDCREQ